VSGRCVLDETCILERDRNPPDEACLPTKRGDYLTATETGGGAGTSQVALSPAVLDLAAARKQNPELFAEGAVLVPGVPPSEVTRCLKYLLLPKANLSSVLPDGMISSKMLKNTTTRPTGWDPAFITASTSKGGGVKLTRAAFWALADTLELHGLVTVHRNMMGGVISRFKPSEPQLADFAAEQRAAITKALLSWKALTSSSESCAEIYEVYRKNYYDCEAASKTHANAAIDDAPDDGAIPMTQASTDADDEAAADDDAAANDAAADDDNATADDAATADNAAADNALNIAAVSAAHSSALVFITPSATARGATGSSLASAAAPDTAGLDTPVHSASLRRNSNSGIDFESLLDNALADAA
jgi:hypothetical protein